MFADERRAKIVQLLQKNGSVSVSGLTQMFQISTETARRDLSVMEANGQLTRVHGGAIIARGMSKSTEYAVRLHENHAEKRELCETALALIEEGDAIFLDCGTTALELAHLIAARGSALSIVTNSVEVLEVLASAKDIQVIMVGGNYFPAERAVFGYHAVETIRAFHVEKAFIFPAAINVRDGVCCCEEPIVPLHRAMMQSADQVFLLADGSKLGKSAFYKVCPLSGNMSIVTDKSADAVMCRVFEDTGIRVIK